MSFPLLTTWQKSPAEEKMQRGVDRAAQACANYDLTISVKTFEVTMQCVQILLNWHIYGRLECLMNDCLKNPPKRSESEKTQ